MKRSIFFLLFSVCILHTKAQTPQEIVQGELGKTIDRYLQKATLNGYAGSILAAKEGNIILKKGYGLADIEQQKAQNSETVFSIGSISKQFTGAAILKLEMQGKLKTTDLMSRYFKDVPKDKQNITLHHLLTHSAGFDHTLGGDYELINREDFIKLALKSPLLFNVGEKYEYSNVGYSLLGIIVELVSGKGYEQYLNEHIFIPAGMKNTGYLLPRFDKARLAVGYRNGERWGSAMDRQWMADGPSWHLRANGGILSTVGDMFLWYRALEGEKILSATAKEKYFYPHIAEQEEKTSFYGYGWVNQKLPDGSTLIWHNGGNRVYNAFMGFLPAEKIVIIASSNRAGKISDKYANQIYNIIQGKFKEVPESTLQELTGTYQLDTGEKLNAKFNENNQLTLEYNDVKVLELLLSNGKETPEIIQKFNQKVKEVLTGIQNDDYTALARAWQEPLEEVNQRTKRFWNSQKEEFGSINAIEVFGTVNRGQVHLSIAKIKFQKEDLFMTYIWEGDKLIDVLPSGTLDKVFEFEKESTFYASNNDKKVVFEKDSQGKVSLKINHKTGFVFAKKM
jgi:CubicO group peptidase (beta-lactamase class C family)